MKNNTIYFIYGINSASEVLKSKKVDIMSIYLLDNGKAFRTKSIQDYIRRLNNKCIRLNKKEYNKKFRSIRSQGIVINFKFRLNQSLPKFSKKNICLLIPQGVEDPQNLGQIIRTSECAGIDGILVSENKSVGITNSVLQVSQGAFLNIPIYIIGNINQILLTLKKEGFWIIGVENGVESNNWFDIDYSGKIVFIFGSEGSGIKKNTLKNCDYIVTIPMLGKTNSLNVSAAMSAILFERNRQLFLKNRTD